MLAPTTYHRLFHLSFQRLFILRAIQLGSKQRQKGNFS